MQPFHLSVDLLVTHLKTFSVIDDASFYAKAFFAVTVAVWVSKDYLNVAKLRYDTQNWQMETEPEMNVFSIEITL